MLVRRFCLGDEPALWRVFHSAVHLVAVRDYTSDQIRAWAPEDTDPALWRQRMEAINPFVVERDGQIVGYADLQSTGYIDHFFVSGTTQGRVSVVCSWPPCTMRHATMRSGNSRRMSASPHSRSSFGTASLSLSIELLSSGASSYLMPGCARRLVGPLRPNPSFHPTCHGWLRQPARAGELKRLASQEGSVADPADRLFLAPLVRPEAALGGPLQQAQNHARLRLHSGGSHGFAEVSTLRRAHARPANLGGDSTANPYSCASGA